MNVNQSEVAQLMHQLDEERKAVWEGMYGLSQVARHQFINAKYEQMMQIADKLSEHVGDDEAMRLLSDAMEK